MNTIKDAPRFYIDGKFLTKNKLLKEQVRKIVNDRTDRSMAALHERVHSESFEGKVEDRIGMRLLIRRCTYGKSTKPRKSI